MFACQTAIVGAGVAGLACARYLEQGNRDWMLFEAAPQTGGRLRTHEQDGFLLDEGFQVLLTAYPEAQRLLDFDALSLKAYEPGALIFDGTKSVFISDPFRRPTQVLRTLFSPVGSFSDKVKIARWRAAMRLKSLEDIAHADERSASAQLQEMGFSPRMRRLFLDPFFRGIFLEKELQTSRRHMDFVFKMFSEGEAALPAGGIQSIARQLEHALPANRIRLNRAVKAVDGCTLRFEDGSQVTAEQVVLATDAATASRWLESVPRFEWSQTDCHYFSCTRPPVPTPHLCLVGDADSCINNFSVPSLVQPGYAPEGKHLVSVTCLEPVSRERVTKDLEKILGEGVRDWTWLNHFEVPRALPQRQPLDPVALPVQLHEQVFVIGDHRDFPSLNGAMRSARLASDAIMSRFAPIPC